jgi:hypothetical protein
MEDLLLPHRLVRTREVILTREHEKAQFIEFLALVLEKVHRSSSIGKFEAKCAFGSQFLHRVA